MIVWESSHDYPNRGPSLTKKENSPIQQPHSFQLPQNAWCIFQGLPEKAYLSLRAGDVSGESPENKKKEKQRSSDVMEQRANKNLSTKKQAKILGLGKKIRPFTAGWEFAPKLGGLGLGGILPKHARRIRWFFRLFFLVMLPSSRSVLILLMEEILHQRIGSVSRYLQCFMMFFIHPRWCRISSINSTSVNLLFQPTKKTLSWTFFFWMGLELQTHQFFSWMEMVMHTHFPRKGLVHHPIETTINYGFKYFSCSPLFGEDSHFD